MKGLDRILDLQELDLRIDRLDARRRELEGGEEVRKARAQAAELEQRIGELRLELDGVVRVERRLDGETSSLEQRIAAEEKRLYDGSVANPKELSSIQAEITSLRNRKTRVEDQELEQMERREGIEAQLPPLEADLAKAREGLDQLEGSSEEELREVQRELEGRREERAAMVPELDEELLDLYESLRSQKRGVGAAALEDGVCQGCHQKLSPLALDRIKRGEGIRRCEYCRRILVPR
jgi:hypothetical protein